MGLDWLPVISQAKSLVQLVCLDVEGAKRTQANFVHECPVVAQVTSTVYRLDGNDAKAKETDLRSLRTISNVADGIPVVGHVKGGVHLLFDDKDGAKRSFNAATRSTSVLGGGMAGMVAGGPVGAITLGITAGVGYDGIVTAARDKPQGYVEAVKTIIKDPNPGAFFDALAIPVGDGLAGYGAGNTRLARNGRSYVLRTKAENLLSKADGISHSGQYLAMKNKAMDLFNQSESVKGHVWVDSSVKGEAGHTVATAASGSKTTVASTTNTEIKKKPKIKQHQEESSSAEITPIFKPQTKTESKAQDSDEECTCEDVNITVLYANMHSINPTNPDMKDKLQAFQSKIMKYKPDIIAIVETFLNDDHNTNEVLKSLGITPGLYAVKRVDRCRGVDPYKKETIDQKRQGGGIFVAWRIQDRSYIEGYGIIYDYKDGLLSFKLISPGSCKSCNGARIMKYAGFSVLYRRPGRFGPTKEYEGETTAEYKEQDVRLRERAVDFAGYHHTQGVSWCIVGDFNFEEQSTIFKAMFPGKTFYSTIPPSATHNGGNQLDLVVTSPLFLVGGKVTREPISDHHALVFQLGLGKYIDGKIRCKKKKCIAS